ncbi:MAG: YggS family pyridoxal phosphate-dependent enzyme [Pseudomonadota bacterium]
MDIQNIDANIANVRSEIRAAAKKHGRAADEITLLAVSKTKPASAVKAAANAGVTQFGENYLQEALAKIESLEGLDIDWHFIGPIQSNKTRQIAQRFAWVHSVDRSKLLRRLSDQRESDTPLNVCLQVNISGEASKAGVAPDAVADLVSEAGELPNLRLRGLMAIPAPETGFDRQFRACAALRACFERVHDCHPAMDTLSIGMSADLEAAVAAGSTMVRIGTGIFGARNS